MAQYKDCRSPEWIARDEAFAQEMVDAGYTTVGSFKHFLLTMGFFPNNEDEARAMVRNIILENEHLQREKF